MKSVIGVFLKYFQSHDFLFDLSIVVVMVSLYTTSTTALQRTTNICVELDKNSIQARHKSCFLRPDTGPCRADIIQYYFDALKGICYRFFWGGCQGNGNRFETKEECMKYCSMDKGTVERKVPHFCSLTFDFGTCFGQYNRWAWDNFAKTCKRRLYSGCGGNQNNFETQSQCLSTCLHSSNNTDNSQIRKMTTCIPFTLSNK